MIISIQGILEIAKLIIAALIVFYSLFFLGRTDKHSERKPWIFLALAAILFLGYAFIGVLMYYSIGLEMFNIRLLLELTFAGLVLLSFIAQHHLLTKNSMILISKKKKGVAQQKPQQSPPSQDKGITPPKL
jgi:amino acid transporter